MITVLIPLFGVESNNQIHRLTYFVKCKIGDFLDDFLFFDCRYYILII